MRTGHENVPKDLLTPLTVTEQPQKNIQNTVRLICILAAKRFQKTYSLNLLLLNSRKNIQNTVWIYSYTDHTQ